MQKIGQNFFVSHFIRFWRTEIEFWKAVLFSDPLGILGSDRKLKSEYCFNHCYIQVFFGVLQFSSTLMNRLHESESAVCIYRFSLFGKDTFSRLCI